MAIQTFHHKGLRKFFETGSKAGIQPALAMKIERILDLLDVVERPEEMNFPGSNFHQLKGTLEGFFSVHVNGNWTIIFRFVRGNALDVNLIDYH